MFGSNSFRRLALVSVSLGSLTLGSVGCSSPPSRSPREVRSTQQLADALVVPADLGGTWKLNAGPEGADLSTTGVIDDSNRDKLPQMQLCDTASQASIDAMNRIGWQAFRQIDQAVENPIKPPNDREGHMIFVQEWLTSAKADSLKPIFDDVSTAFTDCLGDVPAGEEGPGTITEVAIKPIGDQRVAALARIGEAGGVGTWNIYSVFIRAGTVLMGLTAVDIVMGDLQPEMTLEVLDHILSTALSKV